MAAIGEVGTHTFRWLSWSTDRYFSENYLNYDELRSRVNYDLYVHPVCNENNIELPILICSQTALGKSFPLIINNNDLLPIVKRSPDVAFKDGLRHIEKVKIKDNEWMVGKGIILNNNHEPYLIIVGNIDSTDTSSWQLKGIKMYCNPKVLIENNAMTKCIVSHIIPYVLTHDFIVSSCGYQKMKYQLIISDEIYKFFEKPVLENDDDINAMCNSLLRTNIDKFNV